VSGIELLSAIPELPVDDLQKSLAFYRDRLGFAVAFEWDPIAGVQRGSILVHLVPHADATSPRPRSFRVETRGVDALYAELAAQGVVDAAEPLETKPWGMRQFGVIDPSGNRITFAEPVS
jgi:catechol 2,3-dioxygenase-like lactoylglutathione lyase family enzyme